MRTTTIRLLLASTLVGAVACGSADGPNATLPTDVAPEAGPSLASEPSSSEDSVNEAYPEVDRTRVGYGGIIAIAGEMTMEFDYSPPQGHCKASDGQLEARGIGINDDTAGVSITFATIVAPDTGKTVGQVFLLEIRKDGSVPWAANTARSGTVGNITQDISPSGGITLTVTGLISGFHENGAQTGIRAPFRLEVTCESSVDG